MESEAAVSMLKRAENYGLNIIDLTTDEDSSPHSRCAAKVPNENCKRKTDLNHCKKTLMKQLYFAKYEKGFIELNPLSIAYFGRCFTTVCVKIKMTRKYKEGPPWNNTTRLW